MRTRYEIIMGSESELDAGKEQALIQKYILEVLLDIRGLLSEDTHK